MAARRGQLSRLVIAPIVMKRKGYNRRLQAVYLQAVENQLRDNDPPETRQTFDRLRSLGYSERDAKTLIASAIAVESYEIMKS